MRKSRNCNSEVTRIVSRSVYWAIEDFSPRLLMRGLQFSFSRLQYNANLLAVSDESVAGNRYKMQIQNAT